LNKLHKTDKHNAVDSKKLKKTAPNRW